MARARRGGWRSRRGDEPAGDGGQDLWLLTYGDLVTTLMAFFILLYSLSSISAAKFKATSISLAAALGNTRTTANASQTGTGGLPSSLTTPDNAGGDSASLDLGFVDPQLVTARSELTKGFSKAGLQDQVDIKLENNKVVVRFSDSAFFRSGEAALQEQALPLLDTVATRLKALPNEIRVEGHTDSVPISTPQFPSNFALSAARASNVAAYLATYGHLNAERISVAGYGEWKPLSTNETPVGRAANRRVDIVILPLPGQ